MDKHEILHRIGTLEEDRAGYLDQFLNRKTPEEGHEASSNHWDCTLRIMALREKLNEADRP